MTECQTIEFVSNPTINLHCCCK